MPESGNVPRATALSISSIQSQGYQFHRCPTPAGLLTHK